MTSTAKKISIRKSAKDARGFTLLEIVIAIMVAVLILGSAAGVMAFSSDEYNLKKASREVEALAKRARATAILKQTPYALEFTPGMVRLMPLSEALSDEEMEARGFEAEEENKAANEPVRWELSLDNGMKAQMMRWDSEQWIVIGKGERQLWRFDPDGLSEPIALELWIDERRVSMEFNPLTAAINPDSYLYQ